MQNKMNWNKSTRAVGGVPTTANSKINIKQSLKIRALQVLTEGNTLACSVQEDKPDDIPSWTNQQCISEPILQPSLWLYLVT